MKKLLPLLFILLFNAAFGTTYYVGGPGASLTNSGTSPSSPFATIKQAADVAISGDIVVIRSGTYRETVVPVNSGVEFRAEAGANVFISGLDPVTTSWTVVPNKPNIYQTSITTLPNAQNFNESFFDSDVLFESNTEILANQVFQNGEMMHLARWPNVSTVQDLFNKNTFKVASENSIQDVGLTDPELPPGLAGGWVSINGWFLTQTKKILSHNGNTITFTTSLIDQADEQEFRKFYYVTNKLSLLDSLNEWYYDGATLYFWAQGGGIPTGVEYKKRNWGFDLRGKSDITIYGINFIGCDPVVSSKASSNIVIDYITASYINHSFLSTDAGHEYTKAAEKSGIKLIGSNSTIKNSVIRYAGAVGVWLGENCTAENNLFEYMVYDGMLGSPVKNHNGNNQKVLKNTSRHSGRGFMEMSYFHSKYLDIHHNDVSGHNRLSVDGGAIYSQDTTRHDGTQIHHNWFHNPGVVRIGSRLQGVQVTGVYMDQAAGPVTVHHNVHWGPYPAEQDVEGAADFYTELESQGHSHVGHKLYNNTFGSVVLNDIQQPSQSSYVTHDLTPSDEQKNNIYRSHIDISFEGAVSPGNIENKLQWWEDPNFIEMEPLTGLDYQLQAGSPAIDHGTPIAGITNDIIGGTPDIGAYEFGGTAWIPGCDEQQIGASQRPQTPPTPPTVGPLVHLKLNEAAGDPPANAGTLSSTFVRSATTPTSSAIAPTTVGEGHSFDFGSTPGNFYVESSGVIEGLKNLSAFTLTGWVNCRSNIAGNGGNRIISWINDGGDGVDLVYQSDGSLRLGVDGWPDSSPAFSQAGKVTADASAPEGNWVFFAVTYQASNSQVQFYFGNNTQDAVLDTTRTYDRGPVGTLIGKLAIGAFNGATRNPGTLDRMFRGLIDDVQIHGSVLSDSSIVAVQRAGGDVTDPSAPTNVLSPTKTDTSVSLTWTASTDNVGVTGYDIYHNGTTLLASTGAVTSFTVTGLTANTAYSFTLKAKDAAGNISLASTTHNVTTLTTLPSPWVSQDIGSVGLVGSASYSGGTFTIEGSGTDIWNTTDEFRYTYRPLNGDGELVARVTAIENVNSQSKAGIMIRETLTGGSKHALVNLTPIPQIQFSWRPNTSGITSYALGTTGGAPFWVKLKRVGNVITAYESSNGTTWTPVGAAQTITMASNVYIGLAVLAKNNAELNTSIFDNVVFTEGDAMAPTAPTNVLSPTKTDTSVSLTWTASTDNVGVTGYDIYHNGTTLLASTGAVTSFTVTGLTANTAYSFTLKAKDAAGNISLASTTHNVTTLTTLPSPWVSQDIGSVGLVGSASYSGGTFTIEGSGTDIWNTTDEFRYTYRPLNGDGELAARVTAIENVNSQSKAGIMIRETLTGGSKHALVNLTPIPQIQFSWRPNTSGITSYALGTTGGAPFWVKLKRVGNVITAYESSNGTTWTPVGAAQTITMASNVYIGLAVLAKNNAELNTSIFDNVVFTEGDAMAPTAPTNVLSPTKTDTSVSLTWTASTDNVGVTGYDIYHNGTTLLASTGAVTSFTVTGLTANTAYSFTLKAKDAAGNISLASTAHNVTTYALPSPWVSQDIGAVGVAGSASYLGGTFTINGSGTDIWNTTDEFRYTYRPLNGDGELVARVTAIENVNSQSKAGIMIRETLTGGSKHALVNLTPIPQIQFSWRPNTSGITSYALGTTGGAPFWVKLKRVGNVITAYESSNGTTWTPVGAAQTITMASNVYIGLAVLAKNNAELNTSTFDNVTLYDGSGNPMARTATAIPNAKPVETDPASRSTSELYQNLPNPYSVDTEINLYLLESVKTARLVIYDLNGKVMKNVELDKRGDASIYVEEHELNSGMYVYMLIADGKIVDIKRMVLTK